MIASLLAWVFVLPLLVFWLVYRLQRRGLLQAKDVSQRWGFLYRTFRPRYYWFEVLLLGRRVMIVCLAVLLTADSNVRTGSLVGALTGFLTLQVWLRPWVHATANYWEMVSLISLQLLCAVCNGHSIVHDGPYSPSVQVLVSLVVFCVGLSLFVAVLHNACSRSKWLDRCTACLKQRYHRRMTDILPGPADTHTSALSAYDTTPALWNVDSDSSDRPRPLQLQNDADGGHESFGVESHLQSGHMAEALDIPRLSDRDSMELQVTRSDDGTFRSVRLGLDGDQLAPTDLNDEPSAAYAYSRLT